MATDEIILRNRSTFLGETMLISKPLQTECRSTLASIANDVPRHARGAAVVRLVRAAP